MDFFDGRLEGSLVTTAGDSSTVNTTNYFIFKATFEKGHNVTVAVNAEFKTKGKAEKTALKYIKIVGQLPTFLREGINLRAYGQKNPLVEYKHEGFAMFESMMKSTNAETLKRIFRTDISSLNNSTPMSHSNQPKNIQTKSDSNILASINAPQSESSASSPPNFLNKTSAFFIHSSIS